MLNRIFFSCSTILCFLIGTIHLSAQHFEPPTTTPAAVEDDLHGLNYTDYYRWLEDKNDENVKEWTQAQHDATKKFVDVNYEAIEGLREELTAYIDRDYESPLQLRADRQFFVTKKKGDLQPKYFTKLKGKDVLIFDPVALDPSGKTAVSGMNYTRKADKVAVGVQTKGAEIQTYYIIDTKTGKQIGPKIEGLRGFGWTKDEKHAYLYVQNQEMIDAQKPVEIYLHKLGSARSTDKFLLAPDDAKNSSSIYDARYSDVTFISQGDFYATHSLKIKKTGTDDTPKEIYASKEFKAYVSAEDDQFYIFTNHEAPNYKLMIADKSNPEFEHWKDLIPEGETVLESYTLTPNHLLITDKKDVLKRVKIYDLKGNYIRDMEIPEVADISYISYNRDVKKLYLGLSGFTTPFKIYTADPEDLEKDKLDWELFWEQESPIETDNIEGKIVFYPSYDGTQIPLFLVHKKGLELNGNNPTLLYGYGGFNSGMSPSYVGARASFINRGGVYAVACLRGGDEYGESWHRDGMMHKKQNTFDDFYSAAEYLIREKYTNNDKLGIMGGSNGGLLVGAAITQRPELFEVAWCAVPLLDMVRYHKFLIARYWIPEYGDPEIEEDFNYLLTYSPYHNIRPGIDHPLTMVTAGENDTRVDPLHAKKFVASLQNSAGQKNPIMLHMNFDSGHGSGKSTEQVIDEQEFQWRFIMRALGM